LATRKKKVAVNPDISFMKIALKEAKKGLGRTSPNPCVGAVVVKYGEIIAKGYHRKAGTPHAEIHALRSAGSEAKDATLYVTLEPCNHSGRTPPCTEAIKKSGIKKVVVGMIDPNPLVAGSGCDSLTEGGIEVKHGVLDEECKKINRPFIKHITTGKPWVILKAGCSIDGRIAVSSGQSGWITNDLSRQAVHRMRDRVDAILVGVGTALQDNPSLTTRLQRKQGKDPLRVVLDSYLRLTPEAKMLTQVSESETWVFCSDECDKQKISLLEKAGARVIPVPCKGNGYLDLSAVLEELGSADKNSLLVEGGSHVHGSFLRAGLVDQVNLFIAPLFLGSDAIPVVDAMGIDLVQNGKRFSSVKTRRFGDDVLIEGIFDREE
jgi:diaminohydroxyphosphoribosylaminopyrimidine deaminase/5-amino-6-(5-phosphoribosylamino)uracil reductase